MSISHKLLIVLPLCVFILACRFVMAPIEQAQETGATAAAFVTEAGQFVTQVSGFATQAGDMATQMAPFATAFPPGTDEPGLPADLFNPQNPPLTEWNGIPVMPGAIAGDESPGLYGYTILTDVKAVEEFYAQHLPALGWSETFTMPNSSGMAVLVYQKGNQMLTVTITDMQDHLLVMLTMQ
ncbi:MAG: hypothetical protein HFACDABA_00125 [Anaerolineales bacterium]|nr:hypothetical protein [Anaerolineales bacterium]